MATFAQIIRSDNTCISSDKILRGVEREQTQERGECNITTSVASMIFKSQSKRYNSTTMDKVVMIY